MTVVTSPPLPPPAPAAAPGAPAEGTSPRAAKVPGLLIDVVVLAGLAVLALSGLRPAFGSERPLVVGGIGVVLGMAVAFLAHRLARGAWTVAAAVVACYLLVGGSLVAPGATFQPTAPTPRVLGDLADAAVHAWMNLLTTAVPVGAAQRLLVIPFICGLVAGAASLFTTLRFRAASVAAVVPSLVVLVVGIVLGTDTPAWGLQATAFVVVAVLWASSRQRRVRAGSLTVTRSTRWLSAVAFLAVAAALGTTLARTSLVGGGEARTVVRERIEPPIDLRELPSPLEQYRRYLPDEAREDPDPVLFTVAGLEDGDRIRLATLDRYDGSVWRVEGTTDPEATAGAFRRVGEIIDDDAEGDRRDLTVEVEGYRGPWLPDVGTVERVSFRGDRAADLSDAFRYNAETDTGALPGSDLREGDGYVLRTAVPDDGTGVDEGDADPDVAPARPTRIDAVVAATAELSAAAGPDASPLARARAIAAQLHGEDAVEGIRRGYLSDGDEDLGQDPSLPGHGAGRLADMFDESRTYFVGDAEQYASAMALMAIELGLPARVVMGFEPEVEGADVVEVTGGDVTAWVEVAVAGEGWVVLDPTPTDDDTPDVTTTVTPPPERLLPAPPVTVPRASVPPSGRGGGGGGCTDCDEAGGGGRGLARWAVLAGSVTTPPLLLIGLVTLVMALLKRRRRNRRRHHADPARRITGGWLDVCDVARDLGDVVPDGATRRETAVVLGRPGVATLARSADALVFGPVPVGPETAAHYWDEVDTARAAMLGSVSPLDRWKALVNPTSLRHRRGPAR